MNTINRKHHSLKTDPIPFGETMQGRKLWEIRLNDRDFCEGDTVTLHETASSGQEMAAGADLEYTGRSWNGMITWILHGPQYGLAEGWCIFGVVPGFADTAEDIEARLQYQLENSCPHCGGSGHKDDCVDEPARAQQSGEGREVAGDDTEGDPLPCPFCGQEPHRMPHPDPSYPQVQCRNIECPIGINGEEVSLESWNTRTRPPKAQGVPEWMAEISGNLKTQDNRITADPLFAVFQKSAIVVDEDYDHDRIVWVDDEGNEADAETVDQLNEMREDMDGLHYREDEIELGSDEREEWRRLAIKEIDQFVTACFTEAGANAYLKRDGHNLNQPFIFVTSLYRNEEMKTLRKWLISTPPADKPEGGRNHD